MLNGVDIPRIRDTQTLHWHEHALPSTFASNSTAFERGVHDAISSDNDG